MSKLYNRKVRSMPINISEIHKKRFFEKVDTKDNLDECWEWKNYKNSLGYGMFRINEGMYFSHRVAYVLHYHIDPFDKLVCHKCDNPKCCNPTHLFLGTDEENMNDSANKNRAAIVKGEKHHMAKLTELNVISIKEHIDSGLFKKVEIAKKFGVSKSTIGDINKGKRWRHLKTA